MGWLGRFWHFEKREKEEYKQRKEQAFREKVLYEQYIYMNTTGLKTIMTDKHIKEFFSKPDRVITTKYRTTKQYKIDKVIEKIKAKCIPLRISQKFYEEEYMPKNTFSRLKGVIEYLSLEQQVKAKPQKTTRKAIKI